ncbi:hypothetical protein [[Mycoplasma] gypis]|uniref:Uncharacterized protein n=1 Tax=[Mycoplasma] gypis TaxID=92404 RepID=A0ABZ2RPF0_9BACT|nr:hypothetical protein [[Mycoplasma] gypis]MBN0919458.1 hypothetical protein [[Mycoplasma] gypis]
MEKITLGKKQLIIYESVYFIRNLATSDRMLKHLEEKKHLLPWWFEDELNEKISEIKKLIRNEEDNNTRQKLINYLEDAVNKWRKEEALEFVKTIKNKKIAEAWGFDVEDTVTNCFDNLCRWAKYRNLTKWNDGKK